MPIRTADERRDINALVRDLAADAGAAHPATATRLIREIVADAAPSRVGDGA